MIRKVFLLSGMTLLSFGLNAGTMGEVQAFKSSFRQFSTVTAGADFMRIGRAQTITMNEPFINHYTGNGSYNAAGSLGITGGIEQQFTESWFWQLGISCFFNTPVKASGKVWQFGLPEFDNFTYKYYE